MIDLTPRNHEDEMLERKIQRLRKISTFLVGLFIGVVICGIVSVLAAHWRIL